MKVRVYHASYGCETGCCGHMVELSEDGDAEGFGRHAFHWGHAHSKEEAIAWAREAVGQEFGEAHVADLDWEHCEIVTWDGCPL